MKMNIDFTNDLIALLKKHNAYIDIRADNEGYIQYFDFLEEGTNTELFSSQPDSKDVQLDVSQIENILKMRS